MLLSEVQRKLDAGDVAGAVALCRARLDEAADADAYRFLGQIHASLDEPIAARHAAQCACELSWEDPRAWSDLGRVHACFREWPHALDCFHHAVELDPAYADGWHNLGTTFKQIGRREEAFDALRQALLLDGTRAQTYLTLGDLLVDAGQLEDAIICFEQAAAHDPTMAKAHSRLAMELSEQGEVKRAAALFQQSLALDTEQVEGWFGLGRTMEDLGQAESALGCYLNALRRQPEHGLALGHYLGLVTDDSASSPWITHAQTALARESTPDEAKALIGYGLVKYHDRRGQYAEAAQAGLVANAARRRYTGPLDREALTARVDGIIATYTEDFFTERKQFGIGTDQPVFIVGLPRSGTTLTEQILSAHPSLHGAGEIPELTRLAVHLTDETHALPWQSAMQLDARGSLNCAHAYLRGLRQGAPRGRLRISDKSPLNFFHLAFAALLFPNARVIHCRRDARDTALSIWMENFKPDQRYATNFEDLAFTTTQYLRLMEHWHAVLPLQILSVQYENVVADLEGQARRLIDFLGAPWDERCLNFHQQDRAVQTPSRWQVRQPIYTNSVGRWKHYREYLPELEQALTEEV